MPVHQQKGLSLVNGIVRQRQRRRPFINVDTRFINDPLRGFLSILQVFEYRLSGGQKWLFNCSWKSFEMIYCMERKIICLLRLKHYTKMKAFCKEMETICFLNNISWNILHVIFFFFMNTTIFLNRRSSLLFLFVNFRIL